MQDADLAAYLDRICYRGPTEPTAATLRALHLAHLLAVPFENLDIHLGRRISLDEDALLDKIVRRRRGGFCYELNGLFAGLLRGLGFRVDLLAAQFPREPGRVAPRFDHLALLVHAADDDGPWLADVGAGRTSPARPLALDTTEEQLEPETGTTYRLAREGARRRLRRREPGGAWEREYGFSLRPRALADFAPGCRYHQTSPDSGFTRGRICSRLTPDGRVTLSDLRLITTVRGERGERLLPDEGAYQSALRQHVGIELDTGAGTDGEARR